MSRLCDAVMNGNLQDVDAALTAGENINEKYEVYTNIFILI
jgi:hypothetical protein